VTLRKVLCVQSGLESVIRKCSQKTWPTTTDISFVELLLCPSFLNEFCSQFGEVSAHSQSGLTRITHLKFSEALLTFFFLYSKKKIPFVVSCEKKLMGFNRSFYCPINCSKFQLYVIKKNCVYT